MTRIVTNGISFVSIRVIRGRAGVALARPPSNVYSSAMHSRWHSAWRSMPVQQRVYICACIFIPVALGVASGFDLPRWLVYPSMALGVGLIVLFNVLGMRWQRSEDWRSQGRCPTCGYDLRATPERCPECGTDVVKQKTGHE